MMYNQLYRQSSTTNRICLFGKVLQSSQLFSLISIWLEKPTVGVKIVLSRSTISSFLFGRVFCEDLVPLLTRSRKKKGAANSSFRHSNENRFNGLVNV